MLAQTARQVINCIYDIVRLSICEAKKMECSTPNTSRQVALRWRTAQFKLGSSAGALREDSSLILYVRCKAGVSAASNVCSEWLRAWLCDSHRPERREP